MNANDAAATAKHTDLTAAKILSAQTAKGQGVLTDDDKALVERLRSGRWLGETTCGPAADLIAALGAALQSKEDGLNVRDNRIAALEAAGWALFWHAEHDHQCLVRRPNGINLQRCTCGFDGVRKEWKALAGKVAQ